MILPQLKYTVLTTAISYLTFIVIFCFFTSLWYWLFYFIILFFFIFSIIIIIISYCCTLPFFFYCDHNFPSPTPPSLKEKVFLLPICIHFFFCFHHFSFHSMFSIGQVCKCQSLNKLYCEHCWLNYLLADFLTDWLNNWLIRWLDNWLADWPTNWLTDWLTFATLQTSLLTHWTIDLSH